MDFRMERDTMGEIDVPADCLWGAQTQRSLENFHIGQETMPAELLLALAHIKIACAETNCAMGRLDAARRDRIVQAAEEMLAGELAGNFPLSVWQTGSGTQTNMNVNEVLANRANALSGEPILHPNDHVNLSQSSNDVFPTAMHVSAVCLLEQRLLPALLGLSGTLERLQKENADVLKIGRTHLQDATPIRFSQEVSGWKAMMEDAGAMLRSALPYLRRLAIGGTAVGTGLNAPADFDKAVCERLTARLGTAFLPDPNKFHALTSRDALVFAHGALKGLAANLMKLANDVRLLASGPRCGLGEITLPENEPGSSIMPGKVNPTQCEAVTMVAVQVMGNDAAIGMAASQGNFELNVFMPLIAHSFLQSARLLADAIRSFDKNCMAGLRVNGARMQQNLTASLMLVTCLVPKLGYERAAEAAMLAHRTGCTLREAVLSQKLLCAEEFDALVDPEKMV